MRTFYIVFVQSVKYREMWGELVIQPTQEKQSGILDQLLPYLGGKKYETCEQYLTA